jgi:hypothetical protein
MTTTLITKTYQTGSIQTAFSFRQDGWFNMTKAAQAFGKDLSHFMRSPDTLTYIDALSNSANNAELTGASKGRYGGTWAHPKLAVFFARWLDVRFAVWCDAMIEDILKGAAEVVIVKPKESAVMALPKDFASSLRALADSLEQAEVLKTQVAALSVRPKVIALTH